MQVGLEFSQHHRSWDGVLAAARFRASHAVQIIKLLMTQDDASFEGGHYRLERASYNPKPVQQPHPPLWIGGGGEKVTPPKGRN
ncbi:MAG: LLM class flavin-dependent oxidoreductase, partial [Actinomycetota bacterium]